MLIAQPSLSNQLKNVERAYGVQLIIRGPRSIQLTEAGRIFYNKAKEICQIEEHMRVSLGSQQTLYRAQLKISIPAGSTRYYIRKLFSSFAAKNPDISYDVYEIPSDFVIPNVLNGITEIGLIRSSTPQYNNLCAYPYEKEDIVAVIPKGHPLADSHDPLQIVDFTGCSLSVPFDILNIIYTAFAQQAVVPNVSVITSTNGTAVEWARTFNSIALVSCLAADRKEQHDMVIRKINHENMYVMSIFLVHKERRLSEQARMFLAELEII